MKNIYEIIRENKNHIVIVIILVMIGLGQSMNVLADELQVEEKTVINAPADVVWALVGGFQVLDRWHPDVASSTLIGTGKEVGDIRVLKLNNNLIIVEKLELYAENTMTLQYRILESPLPVKNYHATITVKSIDNKKAEVIWQSSFIAVGASNEEAKKTISGIYLTGFNSLIELFN